MLLINNINEDIADHIMGLHYQFQRQEFLMSKFQNDQEELKKIKLVFPKPDIIIKLETMLSEVIILSYWNNMKYP